MSTCDVNRFTKYWFEVLSYDTNIFDKTNIKNGFAIIRVEISENGMEIESTLYTGEKMAIHYQVMERYCVIGMFISNRF